jgi:hypothetical protein
MFPKKRTVKLFTPKFDVAKCTYLCWMESLKDDAKTNLRNEEVVLEKKSDAKAAEIVVQHLRESYKVHRQRNEGGKTEVMLNLKEEIKNRRLNFEMAEKERRGAMF